MRTVEVRVVPGGVLRRCVSGLCRNMADNDSLDSPDYIARFEYQSGVEYVVSFNRLEGGNAPDSRVTLPPGVRFDTGGKLTFDLEVFQSAIESDADAVADFFLTKTTGFSDVAEDVLDSLTDTFDGTFAIERKSLDDNINTLTTRVEELDAILEVRRVRLLQEFIQTETILGTLTSQQQALGSIVPITINRSK